LNLEARPPRISIYQYSFASWITLVFASGVGLCLGQPQLRGERRLEFLMAK
jgi:hypothetical protein